VRSGVAAVTVTLAVVFAGGATASESTLYPGVGIGKLKLGMSAAAVKKVMGIDFIVNKRETVNGARYVEYGWDFAHWTVMFVQHGRELSAVQVETDVHDQRTTKHVGYGTLWRALLRAYPGGRCGWGQHYQPWGDNLEYLVFHKGGTQTLFTLEGVVDRTVVPARIVNYKVEDVRVREPFEPYIEFGPSATPYNRCADGWQTTDTPSYVHG
jgi:hypothetical protein